VQLIVDPDIEDLYIAYLMEKFASRGESFPIGTKVPADGAAESIVLMRTGGTRKTLVSDEPTLTVESRAATETRASWIARTAGALIRASDGLVLNGHQVYEVGNAGYLVNLPDPLTEGPRYTESFSIHLRSTVTTE